MERLGLEVVQVGGRWRVAALLFAVRDELLRDKGTRGAAEGVLDESPKTVEEHGAGDGRGDKENGDDSDANYLPCLARVVGGVALRGRRQDGRCRGNGDPGCGGGFGGVGPCGGRGRGLLCGGCEGRRG